MNKESEIPKKKHIRNRKLTEDKSNLIISEITKSIKEHVGCPAILFVKEGREMIPYFVELVQLSPKVVIARYKCYSPNGSFRCYLNLIPNSISIMTGEQEIVFFDDI